MSTKKGNVTGDWLRLLGWDSCGRLTSTPHPPSSLWLTHSITNTQINKKGLPSLSREMCVIPTQFHSPHSGEPIFPLLTPLNKHVSWIWRLNTQLSVQTRYHCKHVIHTEIKIAFHLDVKIHFRNGRVMCIPQWLRYTPMDTSTAKGTDNSPSFPKALGKRAENVMQN